MTLNVIVVIFKIPVVSQYITVVFQVHFYSDVKSLQMFKKRFLLIIIFKNMYLAW